MSQLEEILAMTKIIRENQMMLVGMTQNIRHIKIDILEIKKDINDIKKLVIDA